MRSNRSDLRVSKLMFSSDRPAAGSQQVLMISLCIEERLPKDTHQAADVGTKSDVILAAVAFAHRMSTLFA